MMTDGAAGASLRPVLAGPDRLRAAAALMLPEIAPAGEAIVAGRGSSVIAARVAALALAPSSATVTASDQEGLPAWAEERRPLVIALSSADDGENVPAAIRDASRLGLPAVVVAGDGDGAAATSAGYPVVSFAAARQPGAGFEGAIVAAVRILHRAGLGDDPLPAIEEAAGEVEALAGGGSGPGVTLGWDLADALAGFVPVILGEGAVAAQAAARWVSRMGDATVAPAHAGEISELAHGTTWREGLGCEARLVVLRDPAAARAVSGDVDPTEALEPGKVGMAGEVRALGAGVLSRFFTLAFVGAATSTAMATPAVSPS